MIDKQRVLGLFTCDADLSEPQRLAYEILKTTSQPEFLIVELFTKHALRIYKIRIQHLKRLGLEVVGENEFQDKLTKYSAEKISMVFCETPTHKILLFVDLRKPSLVSCVVILVSYMLPYR